MQIKNIVLVMTLAAIAIQSCKKKEDAASSSTGTTNPKLVFKFKFDSTQARLNGFGDTAAMASGHAGQCPHFNKMSAHYIELTQDSLTPLGSGLVLYHAPETTAGGSTAIDFDQSVAVGEGAVFFSAPLSALAHGTYNWLRVSLAYQNYTITYQTHYVPGVDETGTVASFIGYNTYITNYEIKDSSVTVNANKLQGYWGFETNVLGVGSVITGQAPPGATTVPNPLHLTSPIPAGSCVVTGKFVSPLSITGSETNDITVTVSLSTNKSFEWIDSTSNNIYEPVDGDTVVDMGVRGMIPSHN